MKALMHPEYNEQPIYIDSDQLLAEYCEQWAGEPALAIDTEFIRTDTFYPIGALIQVSDDKQCCLIDPLAINDFSPFAALMTNGNVVKVLHSCSEDLEVFDRLLGVLPQPLFDTQIAAALDGLGFSLSYQRLTETLLGLHVPKGETRSNWLQRPLTQSQVHYAALDVAYLPEIYRRLRDSLQAKQRLDWVEEDCRGLESAYRQNSNAGDYLQRIKSAWRLNTEELGQLQRLIAWRERTAREQDRPRGRILKDPTCMEIIRAQPRDLRALGAVEDVHASTVRRYGEQVLAVLQQAPDADTPVPTLPEPLPLTTRQLMKRLKARVTQRAGQLQVAEEMLARKKDFEALVRSGLDGGDYQLPDSLGGWRKAVIGDELLAIARQA